MSMKYELKFHYVNLTVSPLSLKKLEQACSERPWFKGGRYSTRPDWLYLATFAKAYSEELQSTPPVTM